MPEKGLTELDVDASSYFDKCPYGHTALFMYACCIFLVPYKYKILVQLIIKNLQVVLMGVCLICY